MLAHRIAAFFAFVLVLGLVASAEDFFHPLKGFTRQVWLTIEKPEAATKQQYDRLITQIETHLRRSGFRVKTGTLGEFNKYRESSADASTTVDTEKYESVSLELSLFRLESIPVYFYTTEVTVLGSGYVLAKDGRYVLYSRNENGENVGSGKRVTYSPVWFYRSNGVSGTSPDWSRVEDAVLGEVDKFINDWLQDNEK